MLRFASRMVLAASLGLSAGGLIAASANAQDLTALAEEAAAAGPVTWYESSPEEQIDLVIEAFNETYPDVEINYVRLVGGNSLASRAVQEMQGAGQTGDVLTGGADHIWQLHTRGYLEEVDWQALGVDEKLTPTDFAVATTASVYVMLWNTDKVEDAEIPTNWEGVVDPKWKGRIGHWVRAASFAQLAAAWGEEKAEAALDEFIALDPFLFASTFPLAQQVAAGEVDLAVGFYHTAQPPIDAGAPLKVAALDPTPMHTIYTAVSRDSANPSGAKLLTAWLASLEGAVAYEAATSRGNPLLEGTETFEFLRGKEIVEFSPEESELLGVINERFNEKLAAVGEPL